MSKDNTVTVKLEGELTQPVIKMIQNERKEIQTRCYANHTIIMAENKGYLQRLIKQFEDTAIQYNMMISAQESKQ